MEAPAGTTHYASFYGDTIYYQRRTRKHLNQVSEEWQTLVSWFYWDAKQWVDVGAGFSSRRLQPIANLGNKESLCNPPHP